MRGIRGAATVLSPVLLVAGVSLTFGTEWGLALISLGIGLAVAWGIADHTIGRRRRQQAIVLAVLLREGQDITRACQDIAQDWTSAKQRTDDWGSRVEQYLFAQWGQGVLAVYNSSDGLPMFAVVRRGTDPVSMERSNYESWLRLRCARLTELLARVSA